ncbi:MAG: L-histidine N(alpha)-methyltransferase [Rhodocyclales bacterium]|nr:L-histidine N(alpha)-methyltransferase [Rhodocyclales bacterium]
MAETGVVRFCELAAPEADRLAEIFGGLSRSPKELPPKYFYDAAGCALFDAICALPEYYLTRAELQLMQRHSANIADFVGPGCELVELGSGTSRKTRLLIEAARPRRYVPLDIARGQLLDAAAALSEAYPWLQICAVCTDYTKRLDLPVWEDLAAARRVAYFPGSTVGNFSLEETRGFLRRLRALTGAGGALVIGVDLKKDPARLHAAYNDAQGVTARFNLNLLAHLNRLVGTDFDPAGFEHVAYYDGALGRIEMHLRSRREQAVTVGGRSFGFSAGELMRTEISCKYSVEEFQALGAEAGFRPERVWFDDGRQFAVFGFEAA